jgi:hemolysin III
VTQPGADLASAALHAVGFALALLFGVRAWAVAEPGAERRITAAFVAAWLLLFAASSLYHALPKDRAYSAVLLAGDHGGIFLLIAACYTPLALVMPNDAARRLIALVWGIGAAGFIVALVAFGAGFGAVFDRQSWIVHLVHGLAPIVLLGRIFFPRMPREVHVCFFGSLLLYVAGFVFYAGETSWAAPWGHPVWHAAILAASIVNFRGLDLLLRHHTVTQSVV